MNGTQYVPNVKRKLQITQYILMVNLENNAKFVEKQKIRFGHKIIKNI